MKYNSQVILRLVGSYSGKGGAMTKKKLGGRIWFNLILFGFMGQVAWNVENMYFNTFLCNFIYGKATPEAVQNSISVVDAVAWMVALSAVTAVITTFIMGNLSDRINNRKIFISVGYILWGIVTGCFGFISLENTEKFGSFSSAAGVLTATVWIVIGMDCLMTFMGSTSNDSAFNAWVTDVTTPEIRTTTETVLSVLPVVAMGVVTAAGAAVTKLGYPVFFFCLGGFVAVCGVLGLFTVTDSRSGERIKNSHYFSDLIYGFRPSVVKENSRLYLALATLCIYSTAVQVFFPYIIVYLQHSELDFLNNISELFEGKALIVTLAALLITVSVLVTFVVRVNSIGKGKCLVICGLLFSTGLIAVSFAHTPLSFLVSCCPFLIGYAMLGIILGAVIRDFTPVDKTGLFQGVRMIFMVLIPMILGPRLASVAAKSSNITYINDLGAQNVLPSAKMFLIAGILGLCMFVTMIPLLKKGLNANAE